jgi:aminoglycoside 6'-N-acetyltransferase
MPPDYTFRKLARADMALFHHWLEQPHLGGWWADGATEWALLEPEIEANLVHENLTDMRIVELNGHPFAYIQDYDVHAYTMPQCADLPTKSRAMDSFLGDPAYLGQGHGSGFIHARATQLLAEGAPLIAVDPDPANTRAIAAYARAGFRPLYIRDSEDGSPVQVMTLTP